MLKNNRGISIGRLKSEFPEVTSGCCDFKFKGRGQRDPQTNLEPESGPLQMPWQASAFHSKLPSIRNGQTMTCCPFVIAPRSYSGVSSAASYSHPFVLRGELRYDTSCQNWCYLSFVISVFKLLTPVVSFLFSFTRIGHDSFVVPIPISSC